MIFVRLRLELSRRESGSVKMFHSNELGWWELLIVPARVILFSVKEREPEDGDDYCVLYQRTMNANPPHITI